MLSRGRNKAFSYDRANEHVLKVLLALAIVSDSALSE